MAKRKKKSETVMDDESMTEDLNAELTEPPVPEDAAEPVQTTTALEHMTYAYEHVMSACAMYGDACPIDTEVLKQTMTRALDSARKIDL